jgi:hypothetical protein
MVTGDTGLSIAVLSASVHLIRQPTPFRSAA